MWSGKVLRTLSRHAVLICRKLLSDQALIPMYPGEPRRSALPNVLYSVAFAGGLHTHFLVLLDLAHARLVGVLVIARHRRAFTACPGAGIRHLRGATLQRDGAAGAAVDTDRIVDDLLALRIQ